MAERKPRQCGDLEPHHLRAGSRSRPEAGRRRDALENAIARAIRRFGSRIYAFDTSAAQAAARLLVLARAQGLGLHQIPTKLADLQIAGIALAYNLELATRNVGDFTGLGITLINPWEA